MQVDALAYLGLMVDKLIEAPTAAEQADEDYEEERRMSGEDTSTANRTTGY